MNNFKSSDPMGTNIGDHQARSGIDNPVKDVYPDMPRQRITGIGDIGPLPKNPLGLPDSYPPFGSHVRIDQVYPPDAGYDPQRHNQHPRNPDLPDMGSYPGSQMGPDHPHFHKHEHHLGPLPAFYETDKIYPEPPEDKSKRESDPREKKNTQG